MAKKDASNLWGIVLDGKPIYQRMVAEVLRGTPAAPGGIAANPVGRVILAAIAARPRKLTISQTTMLCNAGAGTEGPEDDAHPKGAIYYLGNEDDRETTLVNEKYDESTTKGTGKGADAFIEFSAGASSCQGTPNAFDPDQVLLHELVHALRKMQGLENATPLDATLIRQYYDTEEWLAILVENVYQSAKGRTEFRGGGNGTAKLKPPENTSEGFLENAANRSLLKQYYYNWRPVFGKLSLVPTTFNPFLTYTLAPRKYEKPPANYDPQLEWSRVWGGSD